jgi:signal transduction histidine kinase
VTSNLQLTDPALAGLRRALEAALLEHVPLAAALLDSERRILCANPAFDRAFGDPAGLCCHQLLHRQPQPCPGCGLEPVFSGAPGPLRIDEELAWAGGAATWSLEAVTLEAVTIEAADRRLVLVIAEDVTATRELRRELQQTERMAGVGLSVASLAHTIKNLLGGLEGGMYMIGSGIEKSELERVKGGWEMVQRYVAQVSTLVKNLLNYARSREPERKLTDPAALLGEVVRFFEEEARRAGIELVLEAPPVSRFIPLDADLLHACLSNLIANALDACTWDPDFDKKHRIVARAVPEPDGVVLEVEDNGAGIAVEDQAKIMRAVYTTKGIRGTGLGLLLSRKAVQEHGGTIAFESEVGKGTTFRVRLPAAAEQAGEPSEGQNP